MPILKYTKPSLNRPKKNALIVRACVILRTSSRCTIVTVERRQVAIKGPTEDEQQENDGSKEQQQPPRRRSRRTRRKNEASELSAKKARTNRPR